MSSSRRPIFLLAGAVIFSGCAAESPPPAPMPVEGANPVTGEGLPNPEPDTYRELGHPPRGTGVGIHGRPSTSPRRMATSGGTRGVLRALPEARGSTATTNPVDPIFKFDRNTGETLENFGAGVFVTPHGIGVDAEGNVWVTDFAGNQAGTKGHQVHKFTPDGELLMSLGVAGQPGNGPDQLNQPNDVIIAPDGSIFVADGHTGQNLTTDDEMEEARAAGLTGRIVKYSPEGEYIMEWGEIGTEHGQFRTPHALAFDAQGRLWVADRGNHRLEIYDQNGNYLESRYQFGRISDLFITENQMVYAIDSESNRLRHINWKNGVRIGPAGQDVLTGFIPGWDSDSRPNHGVAGEGVGVDADGNVFVAEGPSSLADAGSAFTKYEVGDM